MILWMMMVQVMAMTPNEAVRAALAHSPALADAQAELERAKGALSAANGLRQNPRVDAHLGGNHLELQLSQPLSLSGEGLAASAQARSAEEAATLSLEWAMLETAAAGRKAWVEAAATATHVEIAMAELAAASQILKIATQREMTGEGSTFDVHLARLEEVRVAGLLLEAQGKAADARYMLAALTGDPAAVAAGDPLLAATYTAKIAQERPDVLAAEAQQRAALAAIRQARAALLPPVELGVFYTEDAGHQVIGPTIGLEVPLWSWNPEGRKDAAAALIQAEALKTSTMARASMEASSSSTRQEEAEALLALSGDDPERDVMIVLSGIEAALKAGEMNLAQATLLRAQALEGRRAWVTIRVAVAEARIDAALATADPSLLP